MTFQLRILNCGIEIMRIHANVASGSSSYESIGWANLQDGEISPEALANLKEEEVGILHAQIEILRQHSELKRRVSAYMLHGEINQVRDWVLHADRGEVARLADNLMYEIQELRKALIKRLGED